MNAKVNKERRAITGRADRTQWWRLARIGRGRPQRRDFRNGAPPGAVFRLSPPVAGFT